MTISLKHTFTSAKSDGADATLVQPSNWNAEHTLTAAAGKVLGRDTSGAGAVQELPIAVDSSGNVALGGALSVDGNTTLGNAVGDAVTINAGSASIPNNISFTGGQLNNISPVETTFSPNVFNMRLQGNSSATSGNAGGGISFQAYTTGTTAVSDVAFISGIKENTTNANYAGALIFGTRTNGSGGGSFERVRITSGGNVGIGLDPGTAIRLHVKGASNGSTTYGTTVTNSDNSSIFYTRDDGIVGMPQVYNKVITASVRDLQIDSAGILGYVTSTRATKINIAGLTDVAWLDALRPVTFKYRKRDDEGNCTDEAQNELEYGLIAEEVEQVNPDLTFYDETKNGPELRGVSYSKLIVPLLAKVQELTARVTALEAK